MNRNPWIMLFVLFAVRTAMGFQFQTIASIGPSLVQTLEIDNAQLGLLIGLYLLPGLPLALPSGMIGQRFGAKQVAVSGLVLMIVGGMITGTTESYIVAAAGRLVAGTGGVLLNVMLTKLVADWFADRRTTTAMAILVSSWPLGIALGLAFDHSIATAFGPAAVIQLSAAFTVIALVLMIAVYRNPPGLAPQVATRFTLGLTPYELKMASLAGGIWAAYNAGYIVLVSFASPFFNARGFSFEQSSWIASLLGWLMIPMIPACGFLIDRTGRINLMAAFGFAATAAVIVIMAFSTAPVSWLIVIGIFGALPSGAVMTMAVRVVRPEARAAGMGIYYTLYYAGMGVLPSLAGMARDRTGDPAAPILVSALLFAFALVLLASFLALERPAPKAVDG